MEQIKLEFYFVYDGMIILKSDEYDLYSVNKYSFKDLFKQCMHKKESAD